MAETKRIFTFLLRFIAFCTVVSAAIVMASSRERTTVLAFSFEAKYSDTPALKYFVIVNAIVSIYWFLILFLPSKPTLATSCCRRRRKFFSFHRLHHG
ncbi:CASP-like protein 1C2 [Hibiscus syriacus]|uniref:CASP-like protein n=1 Tax=Hibiscus syriacus TaxID=106335 RepID=A0A6A2WTX3_HIBSY|nr:CASP-like protein 1C2 [Hibiscus syriacus]